MKREKRRKQTTEARLNVHCNKAGLTLNVRASGVSRRKQYQLPNETDWMTAREMQAYLQGKLSELEKEGVPSATQANHIGNRHDICNKGKADG